MKSTLTTLGRILIILVIASIVIAGFSLTVSSNTPDGDQPNGQFSAGNPPADMERPEGGDHDGGGGAFGLLELVKNIGVIGVMITLFYQFLKWIDHRKRFVPQQV
jgi:hypothetical protein